MTPCCLRLHEVKRCDSSDLLPSSPSESLGGVKDLQVTDPTTSSLKVRWEPAEGNVRHYRLFYVPDVGGAEDMVRRWLWKPLHPNLFTRPSTRSVQYTLPSERP